MVADRSPQMAVSPCPPLNTVKRFHDGNQTVPQPKTEGSRVLEYQRSTGRAGDRSPSSWTVKRFFDRIRTPPRRKSAGNLTAEIAHERSPSPRMREGPPQGAQEGEPQGLPITDRAA
ncbi:hypothetical protein COLSTE_01706 [Collinsella stercoris DSM 13279]|uniref:Uncharacterized protein n=1 Tax=Collinsella stercoris DSM 13279 TaxID=445975 RepID=B6GC84_9ACTN|nr:hypothetical protein COLSTE_01706 [Collinsella stercoris DSM 13279]